jgi:hypothetical protein
VGVDGADGLGVLDLEPLEDLLREDGVAGLGRVEAVDGLNEVCQRVASLLVVGEQRGPLRSVQRELEVLEVLFPLDAAVHVVQRVGDLGGVLAHRLVGVQPAPARVLLQHVHQVVDIVVRAADGVDMLVHDVVQELAIEQSHGDHVRVGRQHRVQLHFVKNMSTKSTRAAIIGHQVILTLLKEAMADS